ncbi:multidrug efflux RND transporter permease subunit [Verrucomicrobiaceae bacterium N1E253]|uniref:Multidrug efflux RND transporter permease subunit n=1 Tax=Oceaniferula marina TaxID=2748318 RepID=A0A851GEB4_9BACT|nr:multidrug efflux RND transporter permease subunit [Oceaniferula marina]NWK55509.1 multidrug efflux RND transporter permease subunit [Oceaniferula marina]
MFSEFFIRRPVFATVISIVIIVVGLVSMLALPIARYPDIAPPTISITATYPGADAATVSDTVAAPIETEVNGVENMLYMSSVCGNDGMMVLTVTFQPGTDLDTANVLVQNRVTLAEARLPEEVKRRGVTVRKKSSDIAIFAAITSPKDPETGKSKYDAAFLSNYAYQQLRDEIARVDGVGDVRVFGVGQTSMRLWLDVDKLTIRGLTPSDIVAAARGQNMQVAAGRIGAPPATTGTDLEYIVTTPGRLLTEEEFGNIVLKSTSDKRLIRIKDVARIEEGSESYNFSSTVNNEASAALAIYQIPGTNVMDVANGVKQRFEQLSANFPSGVEYRVIYDSTDVVSASIKEVVVTLFVTLLLVVLTVYIFLQNMRATIIPSVTIPVSLVGTFAVLLAMGFSINQFTLFGLVLVIGIVVDDAIVVVENVIRHIHEGKSPQEAAIVSMREVSGPVIATTLVLLAVFVPTVFIPGITGTLFKQFAITISIATVFSSINALTLSPALCSILLKKNTKQPGKLFAFFNRGVETSTNITAQAVQTAIRRSLIGAAVFSGIVALAVMGFGNMPTSFVPQEDEGYCVVNIQLPDGASLQRTDEVLAEATKQILEIEGVENVLGVGGYSMIDGASAPNSGMMFVVFKDWEERPVPEQHQNSIIGQMNQRLSGIGEAIAFAFPMPSLPGLGTSAGFTYMLQDRQGAGVASLQQSAIQVITDGNSQTGLQKVNTTYRATAPQLNIDIDREQVNKRGVKLSDVYDTLTIALGSSYINDYTKFGRVFRVTAQADTNFRMEPEDIKNLKVRGANNAMIPIGTFASVEEVLGPQTITRFNLYPAIKINGEAAPGFSSGEALKIMEDLSDKSLPTTMGYSWTDLSFQERNINPLAMAGIFGFSILMVYLVLAAQYESWSIPIAVCLSVPTALLGAVIGLNARDMTNNIYTQVGIVLLIGLATKSAILIVEFAMQQRQSGMSTMEAAISAVKIRFRAVLMTAFSFILGVLPLLIASGAGAESRKVLGTTVCFGLLVATIVSLVAVPMIYAMIQSISDKISGKKEKA